MKKTQKSRFLAIAALTAISSASFSAFAAESVQLYGTIDTSARYLNNGNSGSKNTISSGGLTESNFGIKGLEDLGGGLKIGFQLESSISSDTGKGSGAGVSFDRQSTLSLSTEKLGEFRIGRDKTPTYVALSSFDSTGGVGIGSFAPMIADYPASGVMTQQRSDNMVQWLSPVRGGVSLNVAYAPGEGVQGTQYSGGSLNYSLNNVGAKLAYSSTEAVGGDKLEQTVLGGSYDFGYAKVLASVVEGKWQANNQFTYELSAVIPVKSDQVRLGFATTDNGNGDKSDLLSLGYVHNMSARTAVYGNMAYMVNDSAATRTVGGSVAGLTAGQNSSGVEFGLKHSF